jgi:ureidoacrylate peracid hydrolase
MHRTDSGDLTREVAVSRRSALLVVDVQYFVAAPGYGLYKDVDPSAIPDELRYFFRRIRDHVLPNTRSILEHFRSRKLEVMFTTVENLTLDGRDRSLDYKISGYNVPKGSKDAKVLEEIAPTGDEIVFPKTTSSVFNSTTIDYVLRNLNIESLVVTGLLTDQCVESSVRDACDRGYLVTVVEDACGTYTQERHDWALRLYKGYCRTVSTEQLLAEVESLAGSG